MLIIEPSFDFLVKGDEIMLVILARTENPENQFLVFDKKHTLALIRSKYEVIQLTCVPKAILKLLKGKEEIIVTEMLDDSSTVRSYPVHISYDHCLKRKLKKEQNVLW